MIGWGSNMQPMILLYITIDFLLPFQPFSHIVMSWIGEVSPNIPDLTAKASKALNDEAVIRTNKLRKDFIPPSYP